MPRRSFLLCLSLVFAALAFAAEPLADPGLYDYTGDLDGKILIGLSLHQRDGQKLAGSYFYKRYLKDIPLTGEFTADRDVVLHENDAQGKPAGKFALHFAEKDPRHKRGGDAQLTIDVLTGTWTSADGKKTLPVYLAFAQILPGAEEGHRYRVAGAEDDALVERNAQAFCRAVEKGDRQAVASTVRYPVAYSLNGKRTKAANEQEFLKNYDRIFTPKFVSRIRAAVPHNMFARDLGIMLADGAVWFDEKARVFALNN
jgi:hypothetical protein